MSGYLRTTSAYRRTLSPRTGQQYLEHLRSRGVTPPTFEEAWESYRLQPIHGLVMFLNTPDTMQTEEVNRTYLERFVAAAEDLGSLDALAAA